MKHEKNVFLMVEKIDDIRNKQTKHIIWSFAA